MQTSFSATLSEMAVMFILITAGILLVRTKVLNASCESVMSKVLSYIFAPCLTLGSFINRFRIDILREKWQFFVYGLTCALIALLISHFISKPFSKDRTERNIYRYALTFANFGYLGAGLVRALFGEELLFDYLIFVMPLSIVNHAWGITLLMPEERRKRGRLRMLLNPFFLSILAGIILGITAAGDYLPGFIHRAISVSSDCMAPCAMLLTGFAIGLREAKTLLKSGKIYIAAAIRLFVIPAVMVAVLKLAGAGDAVLTCALFAYATPLGLNTVLVPAAYDGNTLRGAGMALVSHTLCVLTIPFLYWLLTLILN